jgi:hypothetical protein
VLVDWYSASVNRPELFYSDGFHLRPRSQRMYADLVSSQLAGPETATTRPLALSV